MKFSFIIPVYNVENYLRECVDSILKQTYKDYEIILVDDGSKDNSGKICDEYSSKYGFIKTVHKENGGSSSTRNKGVEVAEGEYLVFIDSDDFITSDEFLQKVNDKTESSPDLIFYKFGKFYQSTKELKDCTFSYKTAMEKESKGEQLKSLVSSDAFYGMAWIRAIKRALLIDNGIKFEEGLLAEDMDWNYYVMFYAEKFEFIDESFIAYRQREGSVSRNQKIKILTDFIHILEKWSVKIKDECEDKVVQNALFGSLAKFYSNLLIVYTNIKDKNKKDCKKRIKALSWLLKYAMSKRPKLIGKVYKIVGLNAVLIIISLLNKVKGI